MMKLYARTTEQFQTYRRRQLLGREAGDTFDINLKGRTEPLKQLLTLVLVTLLTACSGTSAQKASDTASTSSTDATATNTESATSSPTEEATPTEEPTPEPTQQTTFAVEDKVVLTQDGDEWAQFTVLKVEQAKLYKDPQGYFNDTPEQKGDVFLAAQVEYVALANNVDYNPFDFQVFVDDQALNNPEAFVSNGPKPELGSGTLPKGRKAVGWLTYEVPAKGKVLLSYSANRFTNEAPIFEIVLRAK
jgi:hypothetical protein